MSSRNKYFHYGSKKFKNVKKKDIYENIYLLAIIESYKNINKTSGLENEMRDRIVWDLQKNNPLTSKLFDDGILDIIIERYYILSPTEKRRADICFHWSNFGRFDIECKLLFQQPSRNKLYLEDGLIRFIELKYSKNNEYAAMIGFVVSGNISKIFEETVKSTIVFHPVINFIFNHDILLNWEYSFISNHLRINDKEIQIYHLLFNFQDLE